MMRHPLTLTVSLLLSAVLVTAPSASAHVEGPDEPPAPCPAPEVVFDYDTSQFAASATLRASGCPAREQRQFPFWLGVTRYDDTSAHGATRGQLCGPFRPAGDDEEAPTYSCDVDVTLDHPEIEEAYYEVEVTYPGADGQESRAFEVLCRSGDGSYGCELQGDPAMTDHAG